MTLVKTDDIDKPTANNVQVEWYCDKCKTNHFGNCPKMKVTITTTTVFTDDIDKSLDEIFDGYAGFFDDEYLGVAFDREAAKQSLHQLIQSEVRKELQKVPNHTSVNLYIRDRIKELGEKE